MGGGTILILLLSIFLGLNQHTAQATNLVFFIPTAVTSVFIGIKNKNINIKESWIVLVAGIIGTIISAKLSSKMNVDLLRKMFGIFLLIIAIYEIYSWYKTYIKKEKGHTRSNQKCNMKGWDKMKFVKGMLIGGIVTAGVAMMYSEAMGDNKRKMMKKGKKIAKRMGIL